MSWRILRPHLHPRFIIIIVVIIVSAEDFVEDFFSGFAFFLLIIRLLIEHFTLTFGCYIGYYTDTQAENRTESGAVFLGFNTLSALVRVFGIVVNDFGYRPGKAADAADNVRIAVGNSLRFRFCKSAFSQMLLVKLARILPACRLLFIRTAVGKLSLQEFTLDIIFEIFLVVELDVAAASTSFGSRE